MTGELFEVSNNRLRVVAIDGHRIAIRNVELKDESQDVKVIVLVRHSVILVRL